MKKFDNNLIYALVDARDGEVRYVGRSSSGLRRAKSHLCPCNLKDNSFKSRWIRKNLQHIEIKVLEEVSAPSLLDEREIYWISQFSNLTNVQLGGSTGPSAYKYNCPIYALDIQTGEICRYETLSEIEQDLDQSSVRRCLTGVRKSYKGRRWGLAPIFNQEVTWNRPIKAISSTEELFFANLNEAAAAGFNKGNVSSCLNGKRRMAHGFIWRYKT